VAAGRKNASLAGTIAQWIQGTGRVLLAVDAPLGWPVPFGDLLARHRAGEALSISANELFRRLTDREVKRALGKQPLDVGADRIARTGHAALAILEELRGLTGAPIPLAWRPDFGETIAAIETYPAGTLEARGLPSSGYKRDDQRPVRRAILAGLRGHLELDTIAGDLLADADQLDAAVCVLAGVDFLQGRATPPRDLERARKEGWIWVRPRLRASRARAAGPRRARRA
jgi:predicted RNase H-like nuclease